MARWDEYPEHWAWRGRGWGPWGWAGPGRWSHRHWWHYYGPTTKEELIEELELYRDYLEAELRAVERRIEELKGKKGE